jgi:hypothetical protein
MHATVEQCIPARLNQWSCGMKARAMIDGAPFGPKTVKAIGKTFDQASVRIERICGNDPVAVETARIRLAQAILSVATEGNSDIKDLKNRAIVELAKQYSLRALRE